MNQYETVMIVTPVLSEADVKKTVEEYKDLLKKEGAEIIHEEPWGLKQLAYPIKKKTSGIYHVLEFKGNGPMIDKMEIEFRRDENIMRFLTVKLDKYAIEYNDKKRLGLVGKKKNKPVEKEEA